ncbi:hypothetical protein J2Y58_000585 [Sphingomonas sp. BE138]|nr:hypothetical protein [Sphingomonas sp. BE138]
MQWPIAACSGAHAAAGGSGARIDGRGAARFGTTRGRCTVRALARGFADGAGIAMPGMCPA